MYGSTMPSKKQKDLVSSVIEVNLHYMTSYNFQVAETTCNLGNILYYLKGLGLSYFPGKQQDVSSYQMVRKIA